MMKAEFPALSRRGFSLLAGAAALPLHAARAADLSGVTLRVGTFIGQDASILPAAGQAATPYKLDFAYFSSGQMIIEAANANALDIGGWSEIPQAFAAAGQANVRAVAVLKGDVNNQVVLVPTHSAVTSIRELKGKRVGYVRATTSHYYLLRMLWEAGLEFSDIQAMNLSPQDGAAAFAAGELDAWAIYGYAINFALAQGQGRVLRTARGILSGNYFVGVAPAVLADPAKRAAAADYLVRLAKGYEWLEANKAQWSQILAPLIHVPLPFVEEEIFHQSQPDRIVAMTDEAIASTQLVADTFAKAGVLPPGVNVSAYFDRSFNNVLAPA